MTHALPLLRPCARSRQVLDANFSRRQFLQAAAALSGMTWLTPRPRTVAAQSKRLRVAALLTVFTYRSHAHVILENFLEPYLFNGRRTDPGMDVVALYVDQFPEGDMARAVARQYDIPIFPSIAEALCQGGESLAVDAVLSIGEHGDYPINALGQREYPRKQFFDEAVAVMRKSKRFVPLFNDKHLSYRWDWAKQMYDTAREFGIPLMAGSSVPLAQRKPPLEIPAGAEIAEAVSIHGGPLESYDFHGLEVLQSLVEFRKGGETGISRVEFLSGKALWQAADEGRWARDLAQAAMSAELGEQPENLTHIPGEGNFTPHGILLTYRDGLRATVLKLGQSSTRWNFACRLKGDSRPLATHFHVGPWQNRNLFRALSHTIQTHFRQGEAPYPVERTLLTTGALDAAMHARQDPRGVVNTPHLEFAYAPRDFRAMREMGKSWEIITDQTPEPRGIEPVGLGDGSRPAGQPAR